MRKRILIVTLSILLLVCVCVACLCFIPKEYTVTQILTDDIETGRVKVCGFMSPIRIETKNYFYLTETPYSMIEGTNALPVYLAIDNNFEFKHTDMYIEVIGDLIRTNDKEFRDNTGYSCPVRIINARYVVKDKAGLEQYKALAETGIYEDLYMYYGMLEMLITGQVAESDIAEINEEEFNNILLLFVVSKVTDESLMSIVDKQYSLIQKVNEKIRAEQYSFSEYAPELSELSVMLKDYFVGCLKVGD